MVNKKNNPDPELMRSVLQSFLNVNDNLRSVKKSKTQKTKNETGFIILNLLLLKSRLSKSEIIEQTSFSPTSISNAIKNLLSDGFVTYDIIGDKTKNGSKQFRLTIKGETYIMEFFTKGVNDASKRLD